MSRAKELIETQEFATLPAVATKVLNLLEDDNVEIKDISSVIETDASLTLKILRVANSPLYATRAEINSIQQAIMNLGLNRLTNIVLGVSIFSKFLISSNKDIAGLVERFWWHSSSTGMIAKSLTVKINKFFKETEFIGGLLHDIGKLALIQYDSNDYKKVIDLVSKGYEDVKAETEVYGADHTEVGYEIAKLWKLPEELTQIIRYHTKPDLSYLFKEVISVVRIADLLSEVWDADFYEGVKKINIQEQEAWRILVNSFPDLADLDIEIFTFELESDFRKTSDFLRIIKE
jgi:putative nucleotidyltransferase with HDIG domain